MFIYVHSPIGTDFISKKNNVKEALALHILHSEHSVISQDLQTPPPYYLSPPSSTQTDSNPPAAGQVAFLPATARGDA